MRWYLSMFKLNRLRCVLSREFKIDLAMLYWDFIFGGIDPKHRSDTKSKGLDFLSAPDDPLIHLDYLSVAMILMIKPELLESDFSMCFTYFFNYPEPSNPESIMKYALKVRDKLNDP